MFGGIFMVFKPDPTKDVFIKYDDGHELHLQYGEFIHADGTIEEGYRHIWKSPEGKFQKSGQARIPSHEEAIILIGKAMSANW